MRRLEHAIAGLPAELLSVQERKELLMQRAQIKALEEQAALAHEFMDWRKIPPGPINWRVAKLVELHGAELEAMAVAKCRCMLEEIEKRKLAETSTVEPNQERPCLQASKQPSIDTR